MGRLIGALVPVLLAGCVASPPAPWWPREAPVPARTRGGLQLELDRDGTLLVRPAQDDIEAALGVTLEQGEEGLLVAGQLVATAELREGDVILAARPVPLAYTTQGGSPSDYDTRRTPLATLELLAAEGHRVRRLEDLRGYALCPCLVDLRVVREGVEQVVRVEVLPGEPVALRPYEPLWTRHAGYEACRLEDLPERLRPVHARGDHGLLITSVAAGSAAAVHGLRPLDVFVWSSPENLLIGPDGRERRIGDLHRLGGQSYGALPFVFELDESPQHTRATIFPVAGFEERWCHDRRTDRFRREGRWSFPDPMPLLFPLVVLEERDQRRGSDVLELGPVRVATVGEPPR